MPKLNIINKTLLSTFMLPKALYRKAGADITQLRTILEYKLLMDDRRPNSFHQNSHKKQDKLISMATLGTMLMSLFMGLLFIMAFFAGEDVLTCGFIYFSMFIVMLALTLITDFTNVLIDIRDNFIILPKPVNDATFVIARILHISIHVCKLMLPMALPGLITVFVKFSPIAAIALLAGVLLSTVFTIFLINAIYLLVLKVSSPQKFKNIISYIQIVFAIFIYGGYQIVPRIFEKSVLKNTIIGESPTWLLVPPYWFAALLKESTQFSTHPVVLMAAALALIMPMLGVYVVVRFFAPTFNQKLAQISGSSGEAAVANKVTSGRPTYSQWMANLFTQKGIEQASFLFSWRMMLRNRDFKLKVYPAIGYMLVIFAVSFLRNNSLSDLTEGLDLSSRKSNITIMMLLYITGLVSITSLGQMNFSEHYKAAWMFRVTPVATPGPILSGAVKASIIQFQLPAFMLVAVLLTIINGPMALLHVGVAFCNLSLMAVALVMFSNDYLPWSAPINKNNQSSSVLKVFALLFALGMLGLLHSLAFPYWWGCVALGVLTGTAAWLSFRDLQKTGWNRVKTYQY